MILFQSNYEHIKERLCSRSIADARWLLETVAEINLFLPDDWRMTRSQNNFRIQVISPTASPALVGRSYRGEGDEILHILDSVFSKDFTDIIDLRATSAGKSIESLRRARVADPSLVRPNLYFFQPCPDDSPSPLFARQYEKVDLGSKRSKDRVVEYHRIHALTKAGVDPDHFHWIRWTTDGDVDLVDAPAPSHHGKSFQMIPELKKSTHRYTKPAAYKTLYAQVMRESGVTVTPKDELSNVSYESEYKFLFIGSENDFDELQRWAVDSARLKGLRAETGQPKEQRDLYLDDAAFSLYAAGASFRIRKKQDNTLVTLKKRLPASRSTLGTGNYERIEEESGISSSQEQALLAGRSINAFPFRLLAYVAPGHGPLMPVLSVRDVRTVCTITDGHTMRHAELCHDKVFYEIDGVEYGPFFEIELESKGLASATVSALARDLESLGFIPSFQSKYERGVFLKKSARARAVPRTNRIILDTDCGVDDALALIVALKSRELKVEAITTVAGNVALNKVVPNVFRVIEALGIDVPPPVALGADAPITPGRTMAAESVHGNDGLGDVPGIPTPTLKTRNEPAWDLFCDLACRYPKEITLITVGPLTNLAIAIQKRPHDVLKLKEVVAMGGVFFDVGNVAPDAEFNIAADPDAAKIVVEFCREHCLLTAVDANGAPVRIHSEMTDAEIDSIDRYKEHDRNDQTLLPLTFVGLDVTQQVLLRKPLLDRLLSAHPTNRLLAFVNAIAKKYIDFHQRNEGVDGCYLHDPLAVAYVVNPAFLDVEQQILRVETQGTVTNGVIFPDDRPTTNPRFRNPAEKVIGVARRVEREAFEEFMVDVLMRE